MQIKINLQIFIFILIFVLRDQIHLYASLMAFGFIHECAHIIMGFSLGLKLKRLNIMPFGFSIIFKDDIKIKRYKKILIASAGPLSNFLITIALVIFAPQTSVIKNIVYTNLLIGIFNLIPLYPLDGGRILKEILLIKNKNAENIIHKISQTTVIAITALSSILILYYKNFMIIFVIIYLWIITLKSNKEYKLKKRIFELIQKENLS